MNIKSHFKEKLEKMLFLNIEGRDIYMPVNSSQILEDVKAGVSMEKIPTSYFVYGMFFVLGADEDFKYKERYIEFLKETEGSTSFIKGRIASEIKNENYEEGYVLLKGLAAIDNSRDVFEKLFMVLEALRQNEPEYALEELKIIDKAKEIKGYPDPYFYEAQIKSENKDYGDALVALDKFIELSENKDKKIMDFRAELITNSNYSKGKELIYDEPAKALSLLIPLLEEFPEDGALYYYIGVCYRVMQNYEKSIYYLNEALSIDSDLVQVVNELGINYASLGDYDTAIGYLRKAFEATRSVEICTNLVMCYLNAGRKEEAIIHLELAEKLDPKDEVVLELRNFIKNENKS